jgi:hypothetical protein
VRGVGTGFGLCFAEFCRTAWQGVKERRTGREEVLKNRGGKLETKAKTGAKNVLAFFGAISFVEIVLFFGL